jgi:hypothetical protein
VAPCASSWGGTAISREDQAVAGLKLCIFPIGLASSKVPPREAMAEKRAHISALFSIAGLTLRFCKVAVPDASIAGAPGSRGRFMVALMN